MINEKKDTIEHQNVSDRDTKMLEALSPEQKKQMAEKFDEYSEIDKKIGSSEYIRTVLANTNNSWDFWKWIKDNPNDTASVTVKRFVHDIKGKKVNFASLNDFTYQTAYKNDLDTIYQEIKAKQIRHIKKFLSQTPVATLLNDTENFSTLNNLYFLEKNTDLYIRRSQVLNTYVHQYLGEDIFTRDEKFAYVVQQELMTTPQTGHTTPLLILIKSLCENIGTKLSNDFFISSLRRSLENPARYTNIIGHQVFFNNIPKKFEDYIRSRYPAAAIQVETVSNDTVNIKVGFSLDSIRKRLGSNITNYYATTLKTQIESITGFGSSNISDKYGNILKFANTPNKLDFNNLKILGGEIFNPEYNYLMHADPKDVIYQLYTHNLNTLEERNRILSKTDKKNPFNWGKLNGSIALRQTPDGKRINIDKNPNQEITYDNIQDIISDQALRRGYLFALEKSRKVQGEYYLHTYSNTNFSYEDLKKVNFNNMRS